MRVGWIGLGNIGLPMALSVRRAGHEVTGHARDPSRKEALRAAGGRLTTSLRDAADGADFLGVNVFDDAQLREVLLGPAGALPVMKLGSVVAIHTTGSPRLAQELAERAPKGVSVLDATFSGVADQAARGELTLMVGGDADALERARPALSTYAGYIVHVGPVGAGQRMKLINNTLFAAHVKLGVEALRIAEQSGLDRTKALAALLKSSGASFGLGVFQREAPLDTILTGLSHYLDKDVSAARAAAADASIDLGLLAGITASFGRKPS